jgi:branched-chain amino acid transport system ATP-binding protein
MARPKLLLLGELSLGLAPMMVREIARAITTINQEDQLSIILVEQHCRMARRIASLSYVLETGRIPLQGRSSAPLDINHLQQVYLEI